MSFLGKNNEDIVDSIKVLGMIFIQFIVWDETVQHIWNNLSRALGIIWKIWMYAPHFYYAPSITHIFFFYAHYDYCFLMRGNKTYTKTASEANAYFLQQK